MGEKSAKKVRGHDGLEPGETVLDACYGLGKGFLRIADRVDGNPFLQRYTDEASGATSDPAGSEAARLDRTGLLALTDRRILFLPVRTAIGKPKAVTAAWPRDRVLEVRYDSPMLTLTFDDGSVGGLHVPRAEKPDEFVAASSGSSS